MCQRNSSMKCNELKSIHDIPKEFIETCMKYNSILTSVGTVKRNSILQSIFNSDKEFLEDFNKFATIPRSFSSLLNKDVTLLNWFSKFDKFYEESLKSESEGNPVCPFCGYSCGDMNTHIMRGHKVSKEDFKKEYPNFKFCGPKFSEHRSKVISGDKNPGKNHGGKLSPFSKNFKKYEDLPQSEVALRLGEIQDRKNTKIRDNPQNQHTRIEFYLEQGYSEEESRKLLHERQSTFSLEKCIEKYGEEEGYTVWKSRQERWMESFLDRPEEELKEIYIRRSSFGNPSIQGKNALLQGNGIFYILQNNTDKHIKFGITTREKVTQRHPKAIISNKFRIVFESDKYPIRFLLLVESILKARYQHKIVRDRLHIVENLGWTESLYLDSNEFHLEVESLINSDLSYLTREYSYHFSRDPKWLKDIPLNFLYPEYESNTNSVGIF